MVDTSQYFYRIVVFSRIENEVAIINIYHPQEERQVLEPWFGAVLQLADGQHTIEEMFRYLSSRYNGNPPANLEQTIHSVVKRLVDSQLILLSEKATELPYYLSLPYEQLDVEKAKKLIEKDGVSLF